MNLFRKGGIISKMASLDREDENEEDNFRSWGIEKLKSYLLEREAPIGNTNKQGLINLAVFARKLGLKAVQSVRESQREVESERLSKLSLEGRRIILPDPDTLIEGWEDSAFSYPELSQINVEKYWDESELSIVITIGVTGLHNSNPRVLASLEFGSNEYIF